MADYYREGFIDALVGMGLPAPSAETLCKEAQAASTGTLFRQLFTGLFAGGRLAGRGTMRALSLPGDVFAGTTAFIRRHPNLARTLNYIATSPERTLSGAFSLASRYPKAGLVALGIPTALAVKGVGVPSEGMLEVSTIKPKTLFERNRYLPDDFAKDFLPAL